MTLESLSKLTAACAIALSLAGCGGSFVPATTGQATSSASRAGSETFSAMSAAAPGSISAHPAGSTAEPRSNESVSAHPTFPTSDDSTPKPTPSPTTKTANARLRSRESVSAHPSNANDDGTPVPNGSAPPNGH